MKEKLKMVSALFAGSILISGCTHSSNDLTFLHEDTEQAAIEKKVTFSDIKDLLDEIKSDRLGDEHIRKGIYALEDTDLISAQTHFNRALKFEPTNPNLHFLNGLTYHLRAEAGDKSQLEFAAIGYQLALDNNPSSYWAAFQLGHIHFGQQKYKEAQDAFAYALLYDPNNQDILKALAVASYYAQDIKTAKSSINKVLEKKQNDLSALRIGAMVNAASGNIDQANEYLTIYQEAGGSIQGLRSAKLEKRINDWDNFHQRKGYLQLTQSTSDIFGGSDVQKGLSPKSKISDEKTSKSKSSDKKDEVIPTKMALVDVVIIRSEERRATAKGFNLLSGLSATLGGTTFTLSDARTITQGAANSRVKSFTYNPTLSLSATYSLNIFNDNFDRNEVLARPSLVALDGKKSEFFTGAVFHVELSGSAGSEGAVQDVPVGIKLEVTPKFVDDNTVEFNVEAARAFIEGRSSQIGFNNFAQITKTLVTANVTLDYGQTIILSGLSEKENEKLDDGVPLLQDIPIIQYAFKDQSTLEFTKSVLILMTPRKPRFTYTDGSEIVDRAARINAEKDQPNLDELTSRPDWFKPVDNLDVVFNHLKDGDLFKEFRSGDMRLERWTDEDDIGARILNTLEFLYF